MMKSITFIAILLQFISLINAERISKKSTNNRKSVFTIVENSKGSGDCKIFCMSVQNQWYPVSF